MKSNFFAGIAVNAWILSDMTSKEMVDASQCLY